MKHGSLFSGIGGFDLAAQWMGWENIFHCEWNPFGQKVLKHYWPNAISYNDITKTDFTIHRGDIDILTGGFPCQPYSTAGKRKGKEDDRHLWPQMLRTIREVQPTYVVGENVLGLVSWNGGMVFDEVQADLEAEGYEVQPFILPACGKNAPHRRDRVWFVAHSINGGYKARREKETGTNGIQEISGQTMDTREFDGTGVSWNVTDTRLLRQEISEKQTAGIEQYDKGNVMHTNSASKQGQYFGQKREGSRNGISTWENFPTQSPICNGDDGLSSKLDGITFPKWRNESIKAGGNAIVPQVAYEIFKAIDQTVQRDES